MEGIETNNMAQQTGFLPISKKDMTACGWEQCDFVYVIGDAYVDHSSFGPAIISRVLESRGFKVGIISQPDWKDDKSITILGEPRLAFLVCGGNMDSMVNHYTVNKKHRHTDAYTPGGVMGKRPDRATIVYGNLIRKTYKKTPIIIGGIEASLRRLAHYDYWSDKIKRSILLDSGADLLSYGMGEKSIVEIAEALDAGIDVKDITFVRGTAFKTQDISMVPDPIMLPSYDEVSGNEICMRKVPNSEASKEISKTEASGEETSKEISETEASNEEVTERKVSIKGISHDKIKYTESFLTQYKNTDAITGKPLIEPYPDNIFIVVNPPEKPLTTQEMDDIYALPYMNDYHPSYKALGGVPAIEEIKFSLTSCRGCFGSCSFCALTFHEGRTVQARSHESLISEATAMTHDPDFKGYIHDVGGPTGNFRFPSCEKQLEFGVCQNKECLWPEPCKNLKVDHSDYVSLLRKLRKIPGVKKVFVRSGIRFDYVMADASDEFLKELCKYHISGQLRVAPEHVSDEVLALMGKPKNSVYKAFLERYKKVNAITGKEQYAVPYLMSSHPGSTLKSAIELAEHIRDLGYMPEQVQDFYPTPSTLSTVMFYTGLDPRTMKKVYVPRSPHEKAMQRALIQYKKPENYELVKEALLREHREDLIGFGEKCLIPPRNIYKDKINKSANGYTENKSSESRQNDNKHIDRRIDGTKYVKQGKSVQKKENKFSKDDKHIDSKRSYVSRQKHHTKKK